MDWSWSADQSASSWVKKVLNFWAELCRSYIFEDRDRPLFLLSLLEELLDSNSSSAFAA